MIKLEHANICVSDIDRMITFLKTIFPEFVIRHDGDSVKGHRWVHIGTDETYIALQEANKESESSQVPYSDVPGGNHLAYEVDDVDSIRERLLAGGYKESTVPNKHPYRKRIYFYDPEGNDWEFVQYYTDDPKQKNDYEIADSQEFITKEKQHYYKQTDVRH